ncbi:hypothetical protein ACVMIH_003375 [Bradyrhizobium sp. USDA 4503]|uniref:hypothetical protein n=1 Tax=Bradyrhizobium TaxID=374 RepID=UPI0007048D41|nr:MULTISPECIES: hypothetical protein [Bradyrhizobium]KRQ14112.1 hypothetical protein AOQ73_01130 [Bradyrhizobium pachyrhizi]MCP1831261.1 hypothetical protein [Bradyrhizobium sp. USDA 4545]MCP1924370.1 hypothetical protein [Bradyrhizobium sp. USDA 4532]NLS73556.1 hypothetical protein [Bradyrhizobium brasilense]
MLLGANLCPAPHLLKQSGGEMLVPEHETAKFSPISGTAIDCGLLPKAFLSIAIKPVKTADQALYGLQSLLRRLPFTILRCHRGAETIRQ